MSTEASRHVRIPTDEALMDAAIIAATSKNATTPTRRLVFGEEPLPPPEFSPVASKDDAADTHAEEEARLRREREEEESMELARRLQAEEAMASYQGSVQLLREYDGQLSQEDFDALQNALEEEEQEHVAELEDEHGELPYDAMLELGERIGDVKQERWTIVAAKEIEKLPIFQFDPSTLTKATNGQGGADDSEVKCVVCLSMYEKNEGLRRLPCGHCFHSDCVGQWLMGKDFCPYCRQCIVAEDNNTA